MDRCLLKDPAERFANGEELAEALGRALEVRQEVPVPIRRFAEQNQKSSTAIAMIGLGAAWLMMINIVAVIVGGGWGFTATAFLTVVAVALAATPPLILTLTARRLLGSGYGYDDLIRALLADMELRREELASQHGPPTWIDRWARKLTYGGAAVFLGAVGLIPFVPERMMELIALPMLGGAMTLIGAGLVGGLRHQIRTALPGERWFKFWKSRVGRWLFKLAGVRLGRVPAGGAPYRPTEMAIGMAADRLFEELPDSTQQELLGLPEMIQKLEGDAREMRRQVHELNGILAEIGDDPGRVGNEDRAGLRADLEATREVAERRMTEAVSALEKIRLGLLRLHGGAGSVESLTADLSSAQALSDDIDYLVAGKRDVDELLGIPRPSDELETPTPV